MASEPARAGADWLALREPADAAARSPELVAALRRSLPGEGPLRVHDLGSGTGSMVRWLAPRLPGPQHWVLHDRDADLLARVGDRPPPTTEGGEPVSLETRCGDVTRLGPSVLRGVDLLTASALLDMMTAPELERFVAGCVLPSCPVLVTLSVVGRVELTPADPLDRAVTDGFNAHQRRTVDGRSLLGPDAAALAAALFTRQGYEVAVRPSPWRLGPPESRLTAAWLEGWVSAAAEQQPGLSPALDGYTRRRLDQAAAGALAVTVHHEDLLALP